VREGKRQLNESSSRRVEGNREEKKKERGPHLIWGGGLGTGGAPFVKTPMAIKKGGFGVSSRERECGAKRGGRLISSFHE